MKTLDTVEAQNCEGQSGPSARMPTRPRLVDYRGNGHKAVATFTEAEMRRRQEAIRREMAQASIDAALLTSYHSICYFSDFLYCRFGRRYGLVMDHDSATSIGAGIDGGRPWRRTVGDNVTYTDWQHGNYFHAVRQCLNGVRRLGIEFDHVDVAFFDELRSEFPEIELVDVGAASMRVRLVKSAEEIAHIEKMARIADIGGAACIEATKAGTREYEVAMYATQTMEHEIALAWPHAELMDTWTWFQSGINTDGAHNPVTSREIQRGDILSLNCFPMVAGYYAALERTLFCERASDEAVRLWEINCRVHDRGKELLVPGARCCDVAAELNALYAEHDLLPYRSFGYGHSFGVLCHYYGRETALELREDCETELRPGMVVSMEPMLTMPEHLPGAGGYREHDILVITDEGNRNLTHFPYGPDHLIIGA